MAKGISKVSQKASKKASDRKVTPKSKANANLKNKATAKNASSKKRSKATEDAIDDDDSDDDKDGSDDDKDDDDDENDDDSNDSDNDDTEVIDDEDVKPKKGKASKSKKSDSDVKSKLKKVKKENDSSKNGTGSEKGGKIKKLTRLEKLEEARKAFKWWEAPDLPEGINWRYLEHPGMSFAPTYIPHNIPFKYNDEIIKLTPIQEEMATFYAAIPDDGPQLGNPQTKTIFQENFFKEFQPLFPDTLGINDFTKCDFTLIKHHLELQKNLRKASTIEEKEIKKVEKEKLQLHYSYALVDGRLEKVGNYNMEPPGLFRGRGVHPKTGSLKKRCHPESVTLNLGVDAAVPKCTVPGHAWESIQHDPTVTWLCTWKESVQNQIKYVMLSASSTFKGKSDQDKYGTAIQLKGCIDRVRNDYMDNLDSTDIKTQQLGVAMWVIDRLALRVGGEKDSENEADTVGCCSLRREHITFFRDLEIDPIPSNKQFDDEKPHTPIPDDRNYEIELDFLGKDSMVYKQKIDLKSYEKIGIKIYNRLLLFCMNKTETEQIFDKLSPIELNKHLNNILPGLTAKVFRTYNASITLQNELPTAESLYGLTIQEKVIKYNAANRQVAILCNHQRTVSKATETMFETLNEKLSTMQKQKVELQSWLKLAKSGKKIPIKPDDKDIVEELQHKLQQALKKKENAKTTEEKLSSALLYDTIKADIKKDAARRFEEKHMFKQNPSTETIQTRIDKWNEDINKLQSDIKNKDENKEVALGTSKINYMDPRISVAWCKRCEVPIDKIFAKTLRDKFNWAMAVSSEWKF